MMSTTISLQPLVLCLNMNVLFQVSSTFTSLILPINLSKNLDSIMAETKQTKLFLGKDIY